MAVSIGPRIQVDGEEEYRRKINEIITQSRTLDAEMRALTATFDEETTKQEKATKSSKLLNDQLEVARERTRLVRDMTEQSTAKTGENSTQTLKWREALAAAKEEEAKLERAVRENNAAMQEQDEVTEESDEKMVGLGDAVDQVAGKLGINLPESAKNALNGMETMSAGTVAAMAGAAAGVAVTINTVKALADIAKESAEKVDELNTRAAQTGLDADLLQQLDYAQRFLDFEGIDKTLGRLTQSMGKARDGAEAQKDAFERLGVSIYDEDGKLRDNWETFLDVIDALGAIRNETERDTVSNDLFGKSYAEMKPLIDAGTGALADYMDKAEKLGLVLDAEEREKLQRLNDVLDDNNARWGALKDRLALEVAPTMSGIIELANGAVTAVSNFELPEFGKWLLDVAESTNPLGAAFVTVKNLAEGIGEARAQTMENAEAVKEIMASVDQKQQETAEAQRAATAKMQESIAALAESYGAAYEAAYESLDGQFGLWEKAEEVSATSTETMLEAQRSQLDYWNDYAANFDALVNRNIEGVEDFAQNFSDGSAESAAALAGLRGASDAEIAAIIAAMAETEGAKQEMAARFASLETDLAGNLQGIRDDFGDTMTELQDDASAVDFSAFESAVDEAFSFLESRARDAVIYANSQISQINATVSSAGATGAVGYNADGTDYWRGGLSWVGERGPELVELPRGTRVYSAEESRAIAAAAPIGGGSAGGDMADAVRRGVYEAINELGGMPQSQGPARFYVGDTEIARATYDARAAVDNEHGISMIS